MASTSSTGSKKKIEDMSAFDGLAPSASNSASKLIKRPSYDVFINHRGPDVKYTLASALYGILTGMALSVFLDSEELEYGDFLPRTIGAAITSALLHIAIFSKSYAESPWCLAELSFMLKSGATIIPIFYHVEPTDLRYIAQGKGLYVDAFKKHEEKGRYCPEQLQQWREALYNVSFYTGQIIKTDDDEKRVLKNIVNCVLKVINNVPLVVAKHPVGLKEIVQDFEMNTLQSAQGDQIVQIVGIWGMGGSGKTTLAKELYNKRSSSMDRSSFIFDIRDGAAKGLLHVKQIQLLDNLGIKNVIFDNIEQGKAILKRHLRSIRVLLVFDDVDSKDQLEALLPIKDSLGGGSLIIVTTRECEILRSWGISSIFKMKALDPFCGVQLFCWHAFLKSFPLDGFENLVKKFVKACNGLPLSLKVFGGQLYGEFRKEYWESLLHKISRILPNDIKYNLKVSYDALDYEEKEMFLDTACFFIGEKNSLAIEVWNGSGWSGLHSWERLQSKCLVELDNENCITMHDHLRDLGREIANQILPYRLWFSQQIINAGKKMERRNVIRGIMAERVGEFRHYQGEPMDNTYEGILSLAPSLVGLKIFVIRGGHCNQVIGEISRELIWLRWFEIGQRNLPSQLSLKNLRVLELYEPWEEKEHHLEELWEADNDAPLQLRELVISNCYKFQKFPKSIRYLKNLKRIVLEGDNNIQGLPEEFCYLQSLEHLQLFCPELLSLPIRFGALRNLQYLDMFGCQELTGLPVSFRKLMLLQHLNLGFCHQLMLTSEDFQQITKLEFLRLSNCKQVEELPRHIADQASLTELYLDGIESLRELPINIGQLSRLRKMEIGSKKLINMPLSLRDLLSLTSFTINACPKLKCLPPSLEHLISLTNLTIKNCPKLGCLPPSLGDLSSLTHLSIAYCHKLKYLPHSLKDLSSLTHLSIAYCHKLKCLPPSLEDLSFLTHLTIHNCPMLERLPLSLADISSLTHLTITHCDNLKYLPTVWHLIHLEHLTITQCPISQVGFWGLSNLKTMELVSTEVRKISISEGRCPRLERLRVSSNDVLKEIEALPANLEWLMIFFCEELDKLPSFANLTSLRELQLGHFGRVENIEGLQYCRRLEILKAENLEMLGIESLERMENLRTLELRSNGGSDIERCIQTIRKWPDEIMICTRAVPDAASLVNSFLSPNLDVVDSISNQKLDSNPELVQRRFSNDDAVILCFVINCVSLKQISICCNGWEIRSTWLYQGKWVWIVFCTQRSNKWAWLTAEKITIGTRQEAEYAGDGKEEDTTEQLSVTSEFSIEENEEDDITEDFPITSEFSTRRQGDEDGEEEETAEELSTRKEDTAEEGEEEDTAEELSTREENSAEEGEEEDSAEELSTKEENSAEEGEEEDSAEELSSTEEDSAEETEEDKGECEEVEKGLVLRGEEQRLAEAFHSLLPLLLPKY